MDPLKIIDSNLATLDKNGIWVLKAGLKNLNAETKDVWEDIYDFDDQKFYEDRENFFETKLNDHMKYIDPSYSFNSDTVYFEIGCGPSYIGEHLMKKYDVHFIGLDFNYEILVQLKKHFEKIGLTKFTLIHSDLVGMPILDNSIDYIYGGGVIEHLPDTEPLLEKFYSILKTGGVVFNTIPAFNLWWLIRFYNNIPALPGLKWVFEFLHVKLLKYKILNKYYGYELSYTKPLLLDLHKKAGFKKKDIKFSPFAISPSKNLAKHKILTDIYMAISSNVYTSPVYSVWAKK